MKPIKKGPTHIPKTIQLSQGAGGSMMEALIEKVIAKKLEIKTTKIGSGIDKLEDAGIIKLGKLKLAFTTDGCTVDPMFYPGGSLGSLSVGATINDLCMMGAVPLAICAWLSSSSSRSSPRILVSSQPMDRTSASSLASAARSRASLVSWYSTCSWAARCAGSAQAILALRSCSK